MACFRPPPSFLFFPLAAVSRRQGGGGGWRQPFSHESPGGDDPPGDALREPFLEMASRQCPTRVVVFRDGVWPHVCVSVKQEKKTLKASRFHRSLDCGGFSEATCDHKCRVYLCWSLKGALRVLCVCVSRRHRAVYVPACMCVCVEEAGRPIVSEVSKPLR